MESQAAAEASHLAGKVSEAAKGAAHAVQGGLPAVTQPLCAIHSHQTCSTCACISAVAHPVVSNRTVE